jgi:hypothetical protein
MELLKFAVFAKLHFFDSESKIGKIKNKTDPEILSNYLYENLNLNL